MSRYLGPLIALALFLGFHARADDPAPIPEPDASVRGMTISCHTWGWEWGTDEMVATMTKLSATLATRKMRIRGPPTGARR